jgi:hypothetical protein
VINYLHAPADLPLQGTRPWCPLIWDCVVPGPEGVRYQFRKSNTCISDNIWLYLRNYIHVSTDDSEIPNSPSLSLAIRQ